MSSATEGRGGGAPTGGPQPPGRLYDWAADPDARPLDELETALAGVLERWGVYTPALRVPAAQRSLARDLAVVARPFALATLLRRLADCEGEL